MASSFRATRQACGAGIAVVGIAWIVLVGCSSGPDSCGGSGQALSQPCCRNLGVDACGAGLFCAAFDGRTQASCYAEYTRRANETCTDDRQCISRSCNVSQQKCRGIYSETCSVIVGCTAVASGVGPVFCVDGTCQRVGDGSDGSVCGTNSDCTHQRCSDGHQCQGARGASCSDTLPCIPEDGYSSTERFGLACVNGVCAIQTCADGSECANGMRCTACPLTSLCMPGTTYCTRFKQYGEACSSGWMTGGCDYLCLGNDLANGKFVGGYCSVPCKIGCPMGWVCDSSSAYCYQPGK